MFYDLCEPSDWNPICSYLCMPFSFYSENLMKFSQVIMPLISFISDFIMLPDCLMLIVAKMPFDTMEYPWSLNLWPRTPNNLEKDKIPCLMETVNEDLLLQYEQIVLTVAES